MARVKRDSHDHSERVAVDHTVEEIAFLYQILDGIHVQGLEGLRRKLALMERYEVILKEAPVVFERINGRPQ